MKPEGALLRPRRLVAGSAIGVCAPAGPVDDSVLTAGIAWWEAQGHPVRRGKRMHLRRGYLAGSDDERLADLCDLLRDPEVGAIVLARGGYGIPRLLRGLDPAELRRARKPIVGYSDATALFLFARARARLACIHGPMFERSDTTPEARARLLGLLYGERDALAPLRGEALSTGTARGPLVGGNLRLVAASLGTPWEIDTRGALLFLEEVNEQPYVIDRTLVQLRDAGKLRAAAGVAVGHLVRCESERYPEPSACEVVRELVVPEVSGPVVVGLPFGHVADNRALGHGVRAELDGQRGELRGLDAAVEDSD